MSIVELLRGSNSGSGVSQSSFIKANFFIFTYVRFIQVSGISVLIILILIELI